MVENLITLSKVKLMLLYAFRIMPFSLDTQSLQRVKYVEINGHLRDWRKILVSRLSRHTTDAHLRTTSICAYKERNEDAVAVL